MDFVRSSFPLAQMPQAQEPRARRLMPGDLVEVRPLAEIEETLDSNGCLGNQPFMAEMVKLCGGRFRVLQRVERTCIETGGFRAMENTVMLDDLRCDGAAHGGCQRGCTLLWN